MWLAPLWEKRKHSFSLSSSHNTVSDCNRCKSIHSKVKQFVLLKLLLCLCTKLYQMISYAKAPSHDLPNALVSCCSLLSDLLDWRYFLIQKYRRGEPEPAKVEEVFCRIQNVVAHLSKLIVVVTMTLETSPKLDNLLVVPCTAEKLRTHTPWKPIDCTQYLSNTLRDVLQIWYKHSFNWTQDWTEKRLVIKG